MEKITLDVIQAEIKSKERILASLNDPEYINSLVSRDEISIEEKLKFMKSNLSYEITLLKKDFETYSKTYTILFNGENHLITKPIFQLRYNDDDKNNKEWFVIMGQKLCGKFNPLFTETYHDEEMAEDRFKSLQQKYVSPHTN